jgi:hypothetical protein
MPHMRRILHFVLCVMLAALAAACRTMPAEVTPEYELTDLTGAYVAFFDRTQGLATDARVAGFKADVGARFPGFYDAARMADIAGMTLAQYDSEIAGSFANFPERRDAFVLTAASFQSMLRPAIDSFVRTFNDFRTLGRIALVHSLGEMDGGTRDLGGQSWLVFGADVMARLYPPGGERPFFHHELFHVYHAQFFRDCDPLWCALWKEGLAVHVSEQLNPGATDSDLLLTSPVPIRAGVDSHLAHTVCAIRVRLDSTALEEYASFFYGNSSFEDLPPRSGYYIGYLAAKQAGETHSLSELAHFNQPQARAVLESALAALATCP